jgi:hypothetical protein
VQSVRAQHTLAPLAEFLGKPVNTDFVKGAEAALADAVRGLSGVVLIAWEHHAICALANALMQSDRDTPQSWPDDRFDMVWVFDKAGAGWQFTQLAQRLLPGDRTDVL